MAIATLTSKGRVTIPEEIRRRLGLKPGDKLRFLVMGDGRIVVLPMNVPLRSLYGILPAPPRPVAVEEMNETIRERAVARFLRSAEKRRP